jgi:hypothetical protein
LSQTRRGDSPRAYSASHNGVVIDALLMSIVEPYSRMPNVMFGSFERVPAKRPP